MRLLPFTLLLAPGLAHAAADTPAGGVASMLLGLAVVLATLFGLLHLLKRLQGQRAGQTALRIIGAVSVGPRERVVLVEVADKVLVLGVAPGRVTALDSLPVDALPLTPPASPVQPSGTASADFAARLAAMIRKPR